MVGLRLLLAGATVVVMLGTPAIVAAGAGPASASARPKPNPMACMFAFMTFLSC